MPVRHNFFHKRALISALLLFICHASWSLENDCTTEHIDDYAIVEKIYDGDTLLLSDKRKVRFLGINTPELERDQQPSQPLAEEARQFLLKLIPPGSRIGMRYGKKRKDRYKRILAHIYRNDGLSISAEIIRHGLAFAIVVPPNDVFVDCYFAAEKKAKKSGAGIWSHTYFAARSPGKLSKDDTGFIQVSGKVTRTGKSKKSIWLDMGRNFSVRIRRKNLRYFDNVSVDKLTGRLITVRGWASYYNGKLRMSLRHPAMLEIIE